MTPHIFRSPLPDVTIPDTPLAPFVLRHTARLADKPALIEGHTGRSVTYGELGTQVHAFAGGLVRHGFARGDVLALLAPNVPEYPVVFLGAALAGGVVTTFNPTYTDREIHHQLKDSGATWLVVLAPLLDTARRAAEGTAVSHLVVIGDADTTPGLMPYTSLLGDPLAAPVTVEPGDIVALPYSSGTTGLSKGVMLTHRNLVANICQMNATGYAGEDRIVDAVLPFFHIYGMVVMLFTTLAHGGTVVMLPRFDLAQFLAMHQRYRINTSYLAPPIVLALAKHPMVDGYDLSALRSVTSGAAPLSAELADLAARRLGRPVVQGYGMTEMSPVSHVTLPSRVKPGTVGIPVPNTETMIVDPATGASLGPGAEGELWVRGPQVMRGYLNNPEATAATLDAEGWLHTGDLARYDDDGDLFIADRLKELIKFKGFQVPPAELEGLLQSHPAVADAAVIGRPDDEAGEIPVAFVVLKPGSDADPEAIRRDVNAKVAHYKRIAAVTVLDAIPKAPSGKILRRVLRAR